MERLRKKGGYVKLCSFVPTSIYVVHPDDGIFRILFKRLSTQAVAKFLLTSVVGMSHTEGHRDGAEATSKKNAPKLIMQCW